MLLDEGVQLTRPVTFVGPLAGGWYVDLVRVEVLAADQLAVHDLYVNLVIPPSTCRYEVLDLDELGDALASGAIDVSEATDALRMPSDSSIGTSRKATLTDCRLGRNSRRPPLAD